MNNTIAVARRTQATPSLSLPTTIDNGCLGKLEHGILSNERTTITIVTHPQHDMQPQKTTYGRDLPRKLRFNYFIMVVLFIGVFVRPYYHFKQQSILVSNTSMALKQSSRPSSTARKHGGAKGMEKSHIFDMRNSNATSISPARHEEQHGSQSSDNKHISYAPLFYHISPGSTGSRTLYHAACKSGFPSVHHKSFCNSQTRGVDGVAGNVIQGMRAHFELLRLYELAFECTRLWSKGKIYMVDGNGALSDNDSLKNKTASLVTEQLCNTPLSEWTANITTHLTTVIRSGLVGLFDTPYPYLAPQVLELSETWREPAHPIFIAMTERDPKGWAASRSKNHGIMVCQEEYSHGKLGASEFDLLGCANRAYHNSPTDHDYPSAALHFWDVYQYRSRSNAADPGFQLGMERQMKHHQGLYLPIAHYAPDMFGMQPSRKGQKQPATPIKEKDVAFDIRGLIIGGKESNRDIDSNPSNDKLQSVWEYSYTKPLTCRGRVEWEISNDTKAEFYHLPKTCEGPSKKARKGKQLNDLLYQMMPLVPE